MTTGSIDYTTLRVRDLLNGATSSGDLPSTTEWLKAYGEYLTPYGLASLLELHTAIQREGTANRLIEMLPVSDRPSAIDEIAGNDDAERLASVVEAIAKYDLNSPLVPFVGGELWEGATEPQLRATARLCGRNRSHSTYGNPTGLTGAKFVKAEFWAFLFLHVITSVPKKLALTYDVRWRTSKWPSGCLWWPAALFGPKFVHQNALMCMWLWKIYFS